MKKSPSGRKSQKLIEWKKELVIKAVYVTIIIIKKVFRKLLPAVNGTIHFGPHI